MINHSNLCWVRKRRTIVTADKCYFIFVSWTSLFSGTYETLHFCQIRKCIFILTLVIISYQEAAGKHLFACTVHFKEAFAFVNINLVGSFPRQHHAVASCLVQSRNILYYFASYTNCAISLECPLPSQVSKHLYWKHKKCVWNYVRI